MLFMARLFWMWTKLLCKLFDGWFLFFFISVGQCSVARCTRNVAPFYERLDCTWRLVKCSLWLSDSTSFLPQMSALEFLYRYWIYYWPICFFMFVICSHRRSSLNFSYEICLLVESLLCWDWEGSALPEFLLMKLPMEANIMFWLQ